jgi:hypothetical protein
VRERHVEAAEQLQPGPREQRDAHQSRARPAFGVGDGVPHRFLAGTREELLGQPEPRLDECVTAERLSDGHPEQHEWHDAHERVVRDGGREERHLLVEGLRHRPAGDCRGASESGHGIDVPRHPT